MVAIITSPTAVGVGTTEKSVFTQDNTTGLRPNYRGAICLNDNGDITGDYDDMILRCCKANIVNPGQSDATITNVDYTNQGAFYGHPVSTYQAGNNGHIINGDGTDGSEDNDQGGFNGDSRWSRLENLTYMYSVDSLIISKYTKTIGWPWGDQSGKMDFFTTGSAPQGRFGMLISDSSGNNLLNTLNDVKDNNTVKHLIKFTSLDTNSTYNQFSGEKKWMICTLDSGYQHGFYTNTYIWDYTPIYSNFNLSSNGSAQTEAWGDLVIEIIPPWKNSSGSQAWPKPLEFFISQEGEHNSGFLIQSQLAKSNTYNFDIPAQFVKGDCSSGPTNPGDGFRFTNKSASVYPNVPYYVWAYAVNSSSAAVEPNVKIINVPGGSVADA